MLKSTVTCKAGSLSHDAADASSCGFKQVTGISTTVNNSITDKQQNLYWYWTVHC